MNPQVFTTHHLVKGEDLNHHGTLFAGRGAEWFVEAGFIAATSISTPENTVCLNIHGMVFTRPVRKGSIVRYDSKIVYTGRTSIVVYVKVTQNELFIVDGFLTFINVNADGKPNPHGVTVEPVTPEDLALYEKAKSFQKK